MKNLKLMLLVLAAALISLQAEAAQTKATVYSLKGTAEMAKSGSTDFKPLKVGSVVPVGATIKTGEDSQLVLVPMPSIAVAIGPKAEVTIVELDFAKSGDIITKRKATLDLKEGKLFSNLEKLDPKTTDYQVKMPQGVAAARGTKYTIALTAGKNGGAGTASVSCQEGSITVVDAAGVSHTIGAGQSMTFTMTGAGTATGGMFSGDTAIQSVLNPASISSPQTPSSPNK